MHCKYSIYRTCICNYIENLYLLSTTDFRAYLPEILLAHFQDDSDKLQDPDYNGALAVVVLVPFLRTEHAAFGTAIKALLCCVDITQSNSVQKELHSLQEQGTFIYT